VIGLDMGGTTAKTNLVRDGEPQMAHGYHIGGVSSGQPMMLPVVDTVEIGSGGGSIAWVTDVGALEVGPRSAGAMPGPVCYGLGGGEPTVTDANLVLGRLDPREFLGGEMPLDAGRAGAAIEERIGARLGCSAIEAALAIVRIAVMKMSLAVRQVSVERGCDPRDFALVVFGGAGPLHGVEVARELHIPTVIVPAYPGQFSAAGMLMADLRHDFVRTAVGPLEGAELDTLHRFAEELVAIGRARLADERVPEDRMGFQRYLELRYVGQDFAIPIPVAPERLVPGQAAAIRGEFNATHRRQFGYHDPARPLEIVNVRVTAVGSREHRAAPGLPAAPARRETPGNRAVVLDEGSQPVVCAIYRREALHAGQEIAGPAVIHEYASTTVLFRGDTARVADTGDLVIAVRSGAAA
jgi:N-methylhydantoinase A